MLLFGPPPRLAAWFAVVVAFTTPRARWAARTLGSCAAVEAGGF
jgi:hypothetical protein